MSDNEQETWDSRFVTIREQMDILIFELDLLNKEQESDSVSRAIPLFDAGLSLLDQVAVDVEGATQ